MTDRTSRQRAIGIAATAVLAFVLGASLALLWPTPGGTVGPAACPPGSTCTTTIEVNVTDDGTGNCSVALTSPVVVPRDMNTIKWTIKAPGYNFVDAGHAVSPIDRPQDFSVPLVQPSSTSFLLYFAGKPTSGSEYRYNINVQTVSGKYCDVPILPRITNE